MVKIYQEDFDKLKQLDRIEFRQKQDEIEKRRDRNYIFTTLFIIGLFMLVLFLLLNIISYQSSGEYLKDFSILGFVFVMIIFGFFFDLFILFYYGKKAEKLVEEYFEVKIK